MSRAPKKSNSTAVPEASDFDRYHALDGEWRKIGLSGPARRALVDAKLFKVSDLRKVSIEELQNFPGLGKSVLARIKIIMDAKRIRFKP